MKENKAFTIIEVVITIMIIGILAGAMTPMLSGQLNKFRLDTEIQKLLFDIRGTQQFSLTREEGYVYYGIRFYNNLGKDNDQRGWRILRYEPKDITPPINEPPAANPTVVKSPQETESTSEFANAEPLIYENNMALDKRVSFATDSEIKVGDRIIFNCQSSATTNGRDFLTDANDEITLICGSLFKKIKISPLTGYAQVQ